MIACLIWVIIVAIILLVILLAIEQVFSAFGAPIPANILMLLRLIALLIVIAYLYNCLVLGGVVPGVRLFH